MPRDTARDEVVVEHPSHSAILVVLAYIPARTFNFRVPATRGEAVEMIRRQLQAADPDLNIYNSTPGKDAFLHLVGNPAGKDHARCPLFASCWMVNPTLWDFILRKRELLFAGGSVIAPAPEPVRICYLPANANVGRPRGTVGKASASEARGPGFKPPWLVQWSRWESRPLSLF